MIGLSCAHYIYTLKVNITTKMTRKLITSKGGGGGEKSPL